jgi:hypothetical protein
MMIQCNGLSRAANNSPSLLLDRKVVEGREGRDSQLPGHAVDFCSGKVSAQVRCSGHGFIIALFIGYV